MLIIFLRLIFPLFWNWIFPFTLNFQWVLKKYKISSCYSVSLVLCNSLLVFTLNCCLINDLYQVHHFVQPLDPGTWHNTIWFYQVKPFISLWWAGVIPDRQINWPTCDFWRTINSCFFWTSILPISVLTAHVCFFCACALMNNYVHTYSTVVEFVMIGCSALSFFFFFFFFCKTISSFKAH